jgi:hypothetical protein
MVKTSSNEETDQLVVELIDNYLLRHTIQFFYKTDNGLRPFGSGVLSLIHDTHFILTASHVADHLEKEENNLYIRVDKKGYINVLGDIKYTDIGMSKGVDLAYIKLDAQMIPHLQKPYRFLTIDKIAKHSLRLDGMNYCVIGFPEKNIKFESGSMETGANFYLTSATNENPYDYYKLSKDDYFIVDMKGKGTDIKTGEKETINTEFYGISGCGLWYIMYNLDPNTNKYWADYKLIGIMTQFRKGKYFCLIANKIHLIIEAFKVIEGFKFRERPLK